MADLPVLAAHREIDRLGALARALHRGEHQAEECLRQAIARLRRAAPWLVEVAGDLGARLVERCDCHEATSSTDSLADGFVDDGGVSVLLASAMALSGEDGAAVVIGLVAAALAAEKSIPGATWSGDPSIARDIGVIAARTAADDGITPAPPIQPLLGGFGMPPGPPRPGGLPRGPGGEPPGLPGWKPGKHPWGGSEKPWLHPDTNDHKPLWPWQIVGDVIDWAQLGRLRCLLELKRLLVPEPPPPRFTPVTWATGIAQVEVSSPCGQPRLTIRGQGFGAAQPVGVGVVAPAWDAAWLHVVCRPVPILSWTDTAITVQLPATAVGGVAAFADIAWIALYDAWANRENARVQAAMAAAACAGTDPPAGLVVRHPWSECPPALPAATYEAGPPQIVVEIAPVNGPVRRWQPNVILLSLGEAFRVTWTAVNAKGVRIDEWPTSAGVLAAAGKAPGFVGSMGSALLAAPANPGTVFLFLTASNDCGQVYGVAKGVAVGSPLATPTISAVAPLPGGDVDIAVVNGTETFQPDTRSIALVAGKRTVIRVGWEVAVPQAPSGEQVIVTAELFVHVWGFPAGSAVFTLHPQWDTGQTSPPAGPPLELRSLRAFTSLTEYFFWEQSHGTRAFTFVLPAALAVGDVGLTANIEARSPGTGAGGDDLRWSATTTRTVRFHQRRAVRFRYQRWGMPPTSAPTDAECTRALQVDASLLPIPDPPISSLSPNAVAQNGQLVEDLFALKNSTPGASGRDEIWFTVGPASTGGIASELIFPWTAATDLTRCVSAHEVAHMFKQKHIKDPNCGPADGDDPTTFPDAGQVLVTGWDQWNSQAIVGGTDLMSYCFSTAWMSPERWRRLFVAVGK